MGGSVSTVDQSDRSDFIRQANVTTCGCFVVAPKGNVMIIESAGKYDRDIEDACECINPITDNVAQRLDSREFIVNIDKSSAILKDNVTVFAEGVVQVDIKDYKACVQEISDFLDNMRQRVQSSLRTTLGRLVLDEVFSNRSVITSNVETALNRFFSENEDCAKLCRFEITDISPHGIDLTKESIAERSKISSIINSEAEKQNQQKVSEANYYRAEQTAEAHKYKLMKMGEADKEVIMFKARAEQESIKLLSEVISGQGKAIVKVKLVQEQLGQMRNIYEKSNTTIAPKEATQFATVMNMLGGKGI